MRWLAPFFIALLLRPPDLLARGVYQEPESFLAEVYAGAPPAPKRLVIDEPLGARIRAILGHDLGLKRVRYWEKEGRSAWILDEVGKEQPITTGIVVGPGGIERVKVLIFRESRGFEVRYPFFTDQFVGARLDEENELDRRIDGISGATLSVNALKRLARVALLLHQRALGAP